MSAKPGTLQRKKEIVNEVDPAEPADGTEGNMFIRCVWPELDSGYRYAILACIPSLLVSWGRVFPQWHTFRRRVACVAAAFGFFGPAFGFGGAFNAALFLGIVDLLLRLVR
jgi:hypothetical protein